MTIEKLPARLANQIAAGEVVERPASVIKELVENALDAGATSIDIDVDKGGVKKIRITDNGCGIAKDELTLALSRHATSKIKNLTDLEAIASLGFRGEALASISSVARLTLTSKPKEQTTAWQANAQGRDMEVTIKPAAHPNGTTIEVLDLFFNTPARRKFLRTEKTEFTHIDEVIRRISLAHFEVSFTLTHNSKPIRQYRAANTHAQSAKRVAMVCGQKFVDNAIEVNCQHDDMCFTGWLAKPSYVRNQNDLCYSYVNGRMMRDKLINHAIRQAYAELLPADTYPAFVLFLTLDNREVDVNVHPAKHEVRFHQSRYVHDYIFSVCHQALMDNNLSLEHTLESSVEDVSAINANHASVEYSRPDYVQPLQQVSEKAYPSSKAFAHRGIQSQGDSRYPAAAAVENYQQLMTASQPPSEQSEQSEQQINDEESHFSAQRAGFFLTVEQGKYGVFQQQNDLCLISLNTLAFEVNKAVISQRWQEGEPGLVSQPLLLPLIITLNESQRQVVETQQLPLKRAGIVVELNNKLQVQIRQYPAILRDTDVTTSFLAFIDQVTLLASEEEIMVVDDVVIAALAKVMANKSYTLEQTQSLWVQAKSTLSAQLIQETLLNCVTIDLTSSIKQVESISHH